MRIHIRWVEPQVNIIRTSPNSGAGLIEKLYSNIFDE